MSPPCDLRGIPKNQAQVEMEVKEGKAETVEKVEKEGLTSPMSR